MQTFGCFFAKNRIYSINFIYETGYVRGLPVYGPIPRPSRDHYGYLRPVFLPLIPLHSNSSVSAEMRLGSDLAIRS